MDAIFSQNDMMAIGVLDYCSKAGVNVGRDLKLIGFDNLELSSVSRPRLSTVAVPLFEIGQAAASELLKILSGEQALAPKLVKLSCNIIARESTLGTEASE